MGLTRREILLHDSTRNKVEKQIWFANCGYTVGCEAMRVRFCSVVRKRVRVVETLKCSPYG